MIPAANLVEWRSKVPWPDEAQVEQDLVICRALTEIFQSPTLSGSLAFRGGTALHKLFFTAPWRYSEDIDLVQVFSEPIGPTIDLLREKLDPWLGKPARSFNHGRATLTYSFKTTSVPIRPMKLKVEINTREHGALLGFEHRDFVVESMWYKRRASIRTFKFEELLATKLRALYQRKKGRDLFDLWIALEHHELKHGMIVETMHRYIEREGNKIAKQDFLSNVQSKIDSLAFRTDIQKLLPLGINYDFHQASEKVLAFLEQFCE